MARRAGSISTSSRRRREAPAAAASVRPRKALGQHFLSDRNILNRIVDAAELSPGDGVLEIGAGRGDLTAILAERGHTVTAVEIDRDLAAALTSRFAAAENIRIVEADALDLDTRSLFDRRAFSVVANLPYNAGTAIVRRLLEREPRPRRLVVLLQKEVALAMAAGPGAMSLVSIGVQVYAVARKLFDVQPGAFFPAPRVMSSVVRLDVLEEPRVPPAEIAGFFAVARAGFSAPRKQLRNSLANALGISPQLAGAALVRAGLGPAVRPSELSIDQWLQLSRSLRA
jgi:16S rRNA (adenine1518-N6/adenine1519-N6)-dimethyltransferase